MEIFQNPAPAAFFLGRTSVALVHDDEVKKVRRKQLAEMLLVIVAHQLLIQREIDLVGSDGALIIFGHIDFMCNFLQRCKVLLNGLIHQNITICQIEYLAL